MLDVRRIDPLRKILGNPEFQKLIDEDNWEKVYLLITNRSHTMADIGTLTELLLRSGINPLDSMNVIPDYFLYGSEIESFTIPNKITLIGDGAFENCKTLKSISIPNSVQEMRSRVFQNCIDLERVSISNNLKIINAYAFSGCRALHDVILPDSITSIGECAFDMCRSLDRIVIPDTVIDLRSLIFASCVNLTSVVIGNGVRYVGRYIFSGCSKLKTVRYRGTRLRWKNIIPDSTFDTDVVVNCIDGSLQLRGDTWIDI